MLISGGRGADNADVHQLTRRSLADVLRRRDGRDGQADEGFSLIELMVALFVFAILASGFAMTMGGTLNAFQHSRVKTLGEQIASDKLEDARRMPYDDLGNVAGNPPGTIPLTQTQNVGGYQFTVTTKVSFVSDPVATLTATGADYKNVVVTVSSAAVSTPVTISTYVAPPAKPSADKGRVNVTVNDIGGGSTLMSDVTVNLVNAPTTRTDVSNASGVVIFPDLPPSSTVYYYLTGSLATGYWVYPTSDYTRAGSLNRFLVSAGVSYTKNLNIYKAASVRVRLIDADGFAMLDAASLTVTATSSLLGSLGSQTFTIPAGSGLAPFSTVNGVGVIPSDASTGFHYTFAIDAGGGCVKTDTPADLLNAAYPTDTSFALSEQMPCSNTDVRVHLSSGVDNTDLANTTVTLTGGPLSMSRTVTTDNSGIALFRVRAGATGYTATVPAQNGRLGATTSFAVPDGTPVSVPISLWPAKQITVTLKDGATSAPLDNATVKMNGGPAGTVVADCITGSTGPGACVFTVPDSAAFPNYTITVPAANNHQQVVLTGVSSSADPRLPIFVPWNLTSWPTAILHVVVTGTTSGALGGLLVQVSGGSTNMATITATTKPQGNWSFTVPIGPDAYTITVPAFTNANGTFGPPPVQQTVLVAGTTYDVTVTVAGA